MLPRGKSHVLYDDIEILKRVKQPETLVLLKKLQALYEARDHRRVLEKMECKVEDVIQHEFETFLELMELTEKWLRPEVSIPTKRIKE